MKHKNGPIDIRVITQYVAEQSNPGADEYVFAYTITITNRGQQPAQLLRRYWRITDGNSDEQEVRGDGVVGEQPLLDSGESYRYTSGAMLKTPVGVMEGSYQMRGADGEMFDAPIAAFSLAHPSALH